MKGTCALEYPLIVSNHHYIPESNSPTCTGLAAKVFSKCVETNEGEKNQWGKEVFTNSPDFKVVFNYEFIEDYLDTHSSNMEQGNR